MSSTLNCNCLARPKADCPYHGHLASNSLAEAAGSDSCEWKQDGDGNWMTGCGHDFIINDNATPEENHMRYCTYCGSPLVGSVWVDDEDDNQNDQVSNLHPDKTL